MGNTVLSYNKSITRANEITLLSGVFCILVVFIHISSQPISSWDSSSVPFAIVFMLQRAMHFVVQGFIVLSAAKMGMKYKDKNIEFRSYFKRRVKTILFPYIFWVFIYYMFFCRMGYFPFNIKDLLRYIIAGDLSAQFYFVIVIFQFYLLMPFWVWIYKRLSAKSAVIISLILNLFFTKAVPIIVQSITDGLVFPYYDRIFPAYIFFWTIGFYTGMHYEKFKLYADKYKALILGAFLAFGSLNCFLTLYIRTGKITSWIFSELLGYIHLIYCAAAISAFFILVKRIEEKSIIFKPLLYISKGSYYTYLSHCLVIIIITNILIMFGITSVKWMFLLKILLVYPIVIFSSGEYCRIKARLKAGNVI